MPVTQSVQVPWPRDQQSRKGFTTLVGVNEPDAWKEEGLLYYCGVRGKYIWNLCDPQGITWFPPAPF